MQFTTHGAHNSCDKTSISIHTPDVTPNIDAFHQQCEKSNYIVDASEIAPKDQLSCHDLGINNTQIGLNFGNHGSGSNVDHGGNGSNKSAGCLLESALGSNPSCSSPAGSVAPHLAWGCSGNAQDPIEHHLQQIAHHIHACK